MKTLRLLFVCLASTSSAWAAGWTQPPDASYLKVWNRLLIGDRAYLADGATAPLPGEYVDTALGFYLEYGLHEGTTLIAHGTPYGWVRYTAHEPGDPGVVEDEAHYVGPLSLGVRRRLFQGERLALAAEVQVGWSPPIGTDTVGAGTLAPADCADTPCRFVYRPATEHVRILGELQLGLPFGRGFWFSATAGGMNMAGVTGVIRATAQLGWSASWGLVIDLHGSLHQPLTDVEDNDVAGSGVTEYIGIGPGLSFWFTPRWGVALGAEGVLGAKSNLATPTLTLGVEHR